MKLRNKKTGAIYNIEDIDLGNNADGIWLGLAMYNSLAELNEEWEDYEEPKEYWFIRDHTLSVGYSPADNNATAKFRKEIVGNYFETKEEAEKAVEKLKAWKLLKDYNVKYHLDFVHNRIDFTYSVNDTLIGVVDAEEKIFNAMKIVLEVKNESNL